MMTTACKSPSEQAFLLQVLSDHLAGRQTCLSPELAGLDWQEFCALAHRHQVGGIAYCQCRNLADALAQGCGGSAAGAADASAAQSLGALKRNFRVCMYTYAQRKDLLRRIDESFTAQGIEYILAKGTELAGLYPVPALRSMGDSDMLVHEADKERAHEALLALGFECVSRGRHEWCYRCGGLAFELHHRLLYDEAALILPAQQDYCDTAWEHASPVAQSAVRKALDRNFHTVFLMLHLRKHLLYSGVGLRQFMDLAVTTRLQDIDWNEVARTLDGVDLLEFGKVTMDLCSRWFGISSPWGQTGITPDFLRDAQNHVMRNGVFGFDNPDNDDNGTLNQLHGRRNKPAAKMRCALRALFPAYETMRYVEHYAFLDGRPYLLPAGWAYRFAYTALHGRAKEGMGGVTHIMALDGDELARRDARLSQWGL